MVKSCPEVIASTTNQSPSPSTVKRRLFAHGQQSGICRNAVLVHLTARSALGEIRLSRLRPQHVRALISAKAQSGLSPRSVRYIHAVLRSALGTAVDDDALAFNVAERVRPPRSEVKEVEPLTPEEAVAFLNAVRDDRLEALFTVGTALCLRQGEQLGLQWKSVDLEAGTLRVEWALQRVAVPDAEGKKRTQIHLVPPKQNSRPMVHLPQIAVDAPRVHRTRQDEERIFCGF
jgi:integrase